MGEDATEPVERPESRALLRDILERLKAMPPLAPSSYQAPDNASVVARADRPLSKVINCAFG